MTPAMIDAEALLEDEAYIDRLRRGDNAAFTLLVKHYHPRLVKLAATIAGNTLGEEIVQEAWISIYHALPNFEGRSSLKTWMFTIVRNESLARLKKESRQPMALAASGDAGDPIDAWFASNFAEDGHWSSELPEWHLSTPEALLQESQLMDCIEKNLARLKPEQLAVFRLRELEQLAMEEVCNILEVSHSNARVLLHRARLMLMQVVDRYQETGEC